MLPWLQSGHKRRRYWSHLLICSMVFHLVVLGAFFLCTIKREITYNVAVQKHMHRSDAPVIFMPFETMIAYSNPTPINTPVPNSLSLTEVMQPKPKKKIADSQPAKAEAKKVIKPVEKKEEKKKEVARKNPPAPAPAKKQEKSPPQTSKKTNSKKSAQEQQQKLTPKTKSSLPSAMTVGAEVPKNSALVPVQAHYIGRDDKELLLIHNYFQRTIEKQWRPPVGLDPDLSATVAVTINRQGTIEEVAIEKSSGVLMFDISARAALLEMTQIPSYMHGKRLCVTFKQ